jgi:hypothetical protein
MIEQGIGTVIILVMFFITVLVASAFIPIFGFIRKRWKGLIIGIFLVPVIYILVSFLSYWAWGFFLKKEINGHRHDAMVTVMKTDSAGCTHKWYLKANDECFYEYMEANDENSAGPWITWLDDLKLFDVVPLDSTRVCVDDVIIVSFDQKAHRVSAIDYDEPLQVVSVDWDRVNAYFSKK